MESALWFWENRSVRPPRYVRRGEILQFKYPCVSAVNRIATRTFRDKKNNNNNNSKADSFFRLTFNVYIHVDNKERAGARDKKQRRPISLEFYSGGEKNEKCWWPPRWHWVAAKKKVNRNTYNISSIKRVTRKFLEVSRCSRAKQRQRNVQKSVLHVQSCFFAN